MNLIIVIVGLTLYYCFYVRTDTKLVVQVSEALVKYVSAPYQVVENTVKLGFAGFMQLCLFILLSLIIQYPLNALLELKVSVLASLGWGVLLGIGEFGIALALTELIAPPPLDGASKPMVRGWMRQYRDAFRLQPFLVGLPLTLFYILGEELIFRALFIWACRGWSDVLALVVSTSAFVIAQFPAMTRFEHGIAPAVGAIVVGISHGILFLQHGDIVTLSIAHCTMFFLGMITGMKKENTSPITF
jgi:hypothetical protein